MSYWRAEVLQNARNFIAAVKINLTNNIVPPTLTNGKETSKCKDTCRSKIGAVEMRCLSSA